MPIDFRTTDGRNRAFQIEYLSGRFHGIPVMAIDRAFARGDLDGWRRSVGSGTADVEPPGKFRD